MERRPVFLAAIPKLLQGIHAGPMDLFVLPTIRQQNHAVSQHHTGHRNPGVSDHG
jgi:hypothetical protein